MRLVSQGLITPCESVTAAAKLLTCTQGQDYPGSTLSLALRSKSRSRAEVHDAYDRGEIVRSWPMRGTVFVVPAEDLDWVTSLRRRSSLTVYATHRRELGMTPEVIDRSGEVAAEALRGGGLVRGELISAWVEAGIPAEGSLAYHLLHYHCIAGLMCQGPTAGARQRFVLQSEWIPHPRRLEYAEGVRELLLRYIVARGPVPLDDFRWWCKIGARDARAALADLLDPSRGEVTLTSVEVNGREHYMHAGLPDRYAALRRRTAAPMLLPGFDELVLGYGDRTPVLTKAEERLVVPGGNGMFRAPVIHKGHAVGTWKRSTRAGEPVVVEPFTQLPPAVVNALPRLTAHLPK